MGKLKKELEDWVMRDLPKEARCHERCDGQDPIPHCLVACPHARILLKAYRVLARGH